MTDEELDQYYANRDGWLSEEQEAELQRELEENRERRWKEQFPAMLENMWAEDRLNDKSYLRHKFADDDRSNAQISDLCKRYCVRWPEMKQNNVGLLMYGGVGSGKSFFASCVCNAILDQRTTTICATSFTRILNTMQGGANRQEVLDRLGRYGLILLDDFGAERTTEYAMEQVFHVIDTCYRAQLPVVITTNLSLKELENPGNLPNSRLYDRVLELCPIRIHVPGNSKRKQAAAKRTELARQLLL